MKTYCSMLLFFALLIATSNSYAQLKESIPQKGRIMLEINVLPGGEKIVSFNELQTKYWLTDHIALRLGANWERKLNSSDDDTYSPMFGVLKSEERSSHWGLNTGIEIKLLKNSKIMPYVGFDLSYKNKSSNSEYTDKAHNNAFENITIDGCWRVKSVYYQSSESSYNYHSITTYNHERAFCLTKGNLLFGTNFYLIKHVYFGFEMGLSYESLKYKPMEIVVTTDQEKDIYNLPSENSHRLGFNVNKSIRVGVWF